MRHAGPMARVKRLPPCCGHGRGRVEGGSVTGIVGGNPGCLGLIALWRPARGGRGTIGERQVHPHRRWCSVIGAVRVTLKSWARQGPQTCACRPVLAASPCGRAAGQGGRLREARRPCAARAPRRAPERRDTAVAHTITLVCPGQAAGQTSGGGCFSKSSSIVLRCVTAACMGAGSSGGNAAVAGVAPPPAGAVGNRVSAGPASSSSS
jgi:hypothetical protein